MIVLGGDFVYCFCLTGDLFYCLYWIVLSVLASVEIVFCDKFLLWYLIWLTFALAYKQPIFLKNRLLKNKIKIKKMYIIYKEED